MLFFEVIVKYALTDERYAYVIRKKTGKHYRDCNCCNEREFDMEEKVVGYVRVSTEGQVREGYSLTYQVEEIQRYCNEYICIFINPNDK